MIIIGGSSSTGLAKEVADLVGCRYIEAESTRFPDGECYTRIEAEIHCFVQNLKRKLMILTEILVLGRFLIMSLSRFLLVHI